MLDLNNYILVFQACIKMAGTFWPILILMGIWFLSEWFLSEVRLQDKSRMQTKNQ